MKSRIINNTKNYAKSGNYEVLSPAKMKKYYEILFDNKLK